MLGKQHSPVRLLALVALFALACSSHSTVNEADPFNDPFFRDDYSGTSSLDEILREPSPSVGWLARDGFVQQRSGRGDGPYGAGGEGGQGDDNVLLEAEAGGDDPATPYGEDGEDGGAPRYGEKTFYEKASEATLATMSVLMGAGMAALPFLVGT